MTGAGVNLAAISAGLALRDLLDDWRIAFGAAIGVAAIVTPLLLLAGLMQNYVGRLQVELTRYPSSRELIMLGQPEVGLDLVSVLKRRPDVAFVAPRTRFLSATVLMHRLDDESFNKGAPVDLLPSGPGDPYLELGHATPPKFAEIVLSAPAARKLKTHPGATIAVEVDRATESGQAQRDVVEVTVSAVLPEEASARNIALVDERFLLATEIYRESPTVNSLQEALPLTKAQDRKFAGLRLFAQTVDGVAGLHDALTARGFDIESRRDDIALVKRIAAGLGAAFSVLAGVAAFGGAATLASMSWVMADRKRPELAALRLIGAPRAMVALFPCVQSCVVGLLGWGIAASLSIALAYVLAPLLIDMPGVKLEGIAPSPQIIGMAGAIVLGMAAIAGAAGAVATTRISPAEGLRDV